MKHLHAAAERFDVGIYWEANGHGTVLFGAAFVTRLHKVRAAAGRRPGRRAVLLWWRRRCEP